MQTELNDVAYKNLSGVEVTWRQVAFDLTKQRLLFHYKDELFNGLGQLSDPELLEEADRETLERLMTGITELNLKIATNHAGMYDAINIDRFG